MEFILIFFQAEIYKYKTFLKSLSRHVMCFMSIKKLSAKENQKAKK